MKELPMAMLFKVLKAREHMPAMTDFIITTDKDGKIDKISEVVVPDGMIYSPLPPSTTFSISASAMESMSSAIRLAEEARKRARSNYSKNFYDIYREHLSEPIVRHTHDTMFNLFDRLFPYYAGDVRVIDFGCGTCEFDKHHINHTNYLGIDNSPEAGTDLRPKSQLVFEDFLENGWHKSLDFNPTAFVALFSTEISLPTQSRYDFYKKVFLDFPSIQIGMVSGFYYDDKRFEPIVGEKSNAGTFTVYQTIEQQALVQNNIFEELRCYKNVPSKLWGEQLVEVWKFFIRK